MGKKKSAQGCQRCSSSKKKKTNDNSASMLTSPDICQKKKQNGDNICRQVTSPKCTCLKNRPHGNKVDSKVKVNKCTKLDSGESSTFIKTQTHCIKAEPSTSYKKSESSSEDESKPVLQNRVARSGGWQKASIDISNNKSKEFFTHKMNNTLLDSDESESDSSRVCLQKPSVFSSSDSEDSRPNNTKPEQIATTSSGLVGHSCINGDGRDSHSKHSKNLRSNQKFSKKRSCSSFKEECVEGCSKQILSSDFQHKNVSPRKKKFHNSPRMTTTSSLSQNTITNKNIPIHERIDVGEKREQSSESDHSISSQELESMHSDRSVSPPLVQRVISRYPARYPDVSGTEASTSFSRSISSLQNSLTLASIRYALNPNGTVPRNAWQSLHGIFPNFARLSTLNSGASTSALNSEALMSTLISRAASSEDTDSDDDISVVFSNVPDRRNTASNGSRLNREIHALFSNVPDRRNTASNGSRLNREIHALFSSAAVDGNNDSSSDSETLGQRNNRETHSERSPSPDEEAIAREIARQIEFDERMATLLQNEEMQNSDMPSASDEEMRFLMSQEEVQNVPLDERLHEIVRMIFEIRNLLSVQPERYDDEDFQIIRRMFASQGLSTAQFFRCTLGLQDHEIVRFPTRNFTLRNSGASCSTSEESNKRTEECTICLTDFTEDTMLRILPCFHEFHISCIDQWLTINPTCPICRMVLDMDKLTALARRFS